MAVGGIGLEEGEGEVRWKESHRQEWTLLENAIVLRVSVRASGAGSKLLSS